MSMHAFAAAATLGVNGQALLAGIPFQQVAAELDPAAPDFNEQLSAMLSPWMAARRSFSATLAGLGRSRGAMSICHPSGTGPPEK
ncbi:hypothetical protein GCM10009525_28700 [Streptosporangium amethystogenes subsp. fukuiense]